ncbi:hypothetical protein NC651_018328 [Populus alba x Populus x berolinensis]|nr:hypothetical protein NC651_018328 [Populus alba x Populus x berolinensis]
MVRPEAQAYPGWVGLEDGPTTSFKKQNGPYGLGLIQPTQLSQLPWLRGVLLCTVAGLRGKATVVQRRLALLEEETEVNGGSIGVVDLLLTVLNRDEEVANATVGKGMTTSRKMNAMLPRKLQEGCNGLACFTVKVRTFGFETGGEELVALGYW